MILITHIEPIDFSSAYKTIADLEVDYMLKFKKYYQPEYCLIEAIKRKKREISSKKQRDELAILQYLETEFDKVILSTPLELHDIILDFNTKGWDKYIFDNEKPKEFGKGILDIFGYTKYFRSQVHRGIWLAKQLNIKTCPYCNAQYTLLVSHSKQNSIAKFQFDHFFSKDKYPYLSISLYNLIPSCANCNITKSKKPLNLKEHYHPYHMDFSVYFKFYLKYNPNPKLLTIGQVKSQKFEIELISKYTVSKTFVDEHNKLYHITGVFNRHQDIAEELLMKAVVYTKHLQKAHMTIKGLFPDTSTYKRYLIGNYVDSKDILKRPLAKFSQDIAKQLKLI